MRGSWARSAFVIGAIALASPIALAVPPGRGVAEQPADAPETVLARARQAYGRGDYALAVSLVQPLLAPPVQVGADDETDAHKLLALCYFFLRDLPKVEDEFNTLLQLDSNFHLDGVIDPPGAVALLSQLRDRNQLKLHEITEQRLREKLEEERRRRAEAERRVREAARPEVIERTIRHNTRLVALLPFGVGQFQNGHPTRGGLFFASQLLLGAGSVAMYSAVRLRWPNSYFRPPEKALAQTLQISAVVLGALFWADVVVGIIEALASFRPLLVESERARPAVDKTPPKLGFVPFASPTSAGAALQGVF